MTGPSVARKANAHICRGSAPRDGRNGGGVRGVSIALSCRAFGVSKTCYRYSPKLRAENEEIADLLVGLTEARKT